MAGSTGPLGLAGELGVLAAKVSGGEPLTAADRDMLVGTSDLLALGMLAEEGRRRLHGDRITFVRVARVPLRAEPGQNSGVPLAAGEIRIDGPLDDLAQAIDRIRRIKALAARRPVSAFTAGDLERFAAATGIARSDLFRTLREAGAELIAELEFDQIEAPFAICEAAAAAGLKIARVTIREQPRQGVLPLLAELRSVQSALGTLHAFAPLPRTLSGAAPATGYDDVKQVALARLLVENIPTIQIDWALYGPKLAQVALAFGADDVDGIVPADGELPVKGGAREQGWRRSALEEIRHNIRSASLVPVERNGRFELLALRRAERGGASSRPESTPPSNK